MIVLSEIIMDSDGVDSNGSLKSRDLLRTILELRIEVEFLKHVREDWNPNFVATFVRAVRSR